MAEPKKRGVGQRGPGRKKLAELFRLDRGGTMPVPAILKAMRYWARIADRELEKPEGGATRTIVDLRGREREEVDPSTIPDLDVIEHAFDKMLMFAKEAAPYIHSKLSAVAHFGGEEADKVEAFRGARDRLEQAIRLIEDRTTGVFRAAGVEPDREAEEIDAGEASGGLGTTH